MGSTNVIILQLATAFALASGLLQFWLIRLMAAHRRSYADTDTEAWSQLIKSRKFVRISTLSMTLILLAGVASLVSLFFSPLDS